MTLFAEPNTKKEIKYILSNLEKAIKQTGIINSEIIKLETRVKFLINDNDLLQMISDQEAYKNFFSQSRRCQDLINLILLIHEDSDLFEEYRRKQVSLNRHYCDNIDKLHDNLGFFFRSLSICFLVALILGYIAFAIASASLGHTSSLVLATGLFFDIVGYGLLGSGVSALLIYLVSKPIVNSTLNLYHKRSLDKIENVFYNEIKLTDDDCDAISTKYEDIGLLAPKTNQP